MTYKEFLNKCHIIGEKEFNEIMNSLPYDDFIGDISLVDMYDSEDMNEITRELINAMLEDNFSYAYVENVDFEKKEFSLEDCYSLEDLEEIKTSFKGWNIINYDELKEDFLKDEEEEKRTSDFDRYINKIKSNASLEDLKKICFDYDY